MGVPWLVYRDSPLLDYDIIPNILGSIIPELIINQQGLSSHCSGVHVHDDVQYINSQTSNTETIVT
jgi:hypothetical protein